MNTDLLLKFSFIASHSLIGNEKPHPHVWKLAVCLRGTPCDGKIVDMVAARESIAELFQPLQNTYLNTHEQLNSETQKAPTCETLSLYFWKKIEDLTLKKFKPNNTSIKLQSVSIAIADPGAEELGQITLSV